MRKLVFQGGVPGHRPYGMTKAGGERYAELRCHCGEAALRRVYDRGFCKAHMAEATAAQAAQLPEAVSIWARGADGKPCV